MAEETSEAAQERRRLAREEILQRGVVFEARRRKKQSSPPNSFDTLVDDRGKLRDDDLLDTSSNSLAKSTAIDLSASQPVPSEKQNDGSIPDAADRNRLHLELPSDSPKTHSETLVDLTPTSEAATPLSMPANGTSEEIRPAGFFHDVGHEDLGARSAPSSCSADSDDSLGFYSPHPDPNNESQQNFASPFADFQSSSPTSATGGSFSHIYEVEGGSDGTASDFGRSSDGAATPASWSEIGSVISSEEVYHQGM